MKESTELLTIKQASEWASQHLSRNVTPSNISYLIQYGRIKKVANNERTLVNKEDLVSYYESHIGKKETNWITRLGEDLNWTLSFDYLKESERTKHVHRLHPYKGKFIPQLVEYFLDSHTDHFKTEVYFKEGDIILDPFCGSGTTLIQANELGMHAIGIDISSFNVLITNVKTRNYDLDKLSDEINRITLALGQFNSDSNIQEFRQELAEVLADFNKRYFPSPDFKIRVRSGDIDGDEYGKAKAREFAYTYKSLVSRYNIQLNQGENSNFLDRWYIKSVRQEMYFVHGLVKQIQDSNIRDLLSIILTRTIRSCRATTHFDLATLKNPTLSTYYCHKHGKICMPIFSIVNWWTRYSKDTVKRLAEYDQLRTETKQVCLTGDSRTIDVLEELENYDPELATIIRSQKMKGIFSSPPYVGLIDYHDQHAYAYDLFDFERKDELEIGTLSNGQGKEARESYIKSISEVLNNCRGFLVDDFEVFLVANDRYNLYPTIAEKSDMRIVKQYKRPVLNRTERDKGVYSETIFHMRA